MDKVVVDTSIFIEYGRTGSGPWQTLVELSEAGIMELMVPTIVLYEFWSGKSLNKPVLESAANQLFDDLNLVELTAEMAKTAGALSRSETVKGMDSLIAATCLVEKAQLATLNTKHFINIPELELWKPASI